MKRPFISVLATVVLLLFVFAPSADFLTRDFPSTILGYEAGDEENSPDLRSQKIRIHSKLLSAPFVAERNLCLRPADIFSGVCCPPAILALRL